LPIAGTDELKQTNEIKIAAPLLDAIDIKNKTISADALLTQTQLANYIVGRDAHFQFMVKGNQGQLLEDLQLYFRHSSEPDFFTVESGHGRIETRRIWVTTQLNGYLKFPHVAQAFMIEREVIHKKSSKTTLEKAYGITSRSADQVSPENILRINRGHWCIENSCHYILDWNFDEDRCRIRTGHGAENMTRLRRFAISICKLRGVKNVAQKMRELSRNTRLVFDYLRMTKNSCVLG